jgi:hypothetical protein
LADLIESESGSSLLFDAFFSGEPASTSHQNAMVASAADALYHTNDAGLGISDGSCVSLP